MTTAADLPEAAIFLDMCKTARRPITGLRLLSLSLDNGKSYETATAMLSALMRQGKITCTGSDPNCKSHYGDLVGQLYSAPSSANNS